MPLCETPEWQSLQARVNAGKIPHALLVTGASSAMLPFARGFATALLCDSPHKSTGAACGECRACKRVGAGSHGDYIEVSPGDDSRVIKIQQIRAMCVELGLTAQHNGYRVVIISPADVMHAGAANSLLKTLEEPRPNVVIILVSSKLGAIPITIRSRCQRVRITAPDQALGIDHKSTLYDESLQAWQSGLMSQRDYIAIANDWSKADHEVIFHTLFNWLSSQLKKCFMIDDCPGPGLENYVDTNRQKTFKIEVGQLMAFYDKLLPAYQFAAKPGVNRRALYEQLFIEAQTIKPYQKESI